MKLWKLTIRHLGLLRSECKPVFKYIALSAAITNGKDAVSYIRLHKFAVEWWEDNLLCDIEWVDDLWYVQDVEQEED